MASPIVIDGTDLLDVNGKINLVFVPTTIPLSVSQVIGDANATIADSTTIVRVNAALTTTRVYTLPAASVFPAGKGFEVIFEVAQTQISRFSKVSSDTINGATTLDWTGAIGDHLFFSSDGVSVWSVASSSTNSSGLPSQTSNSGKYLSTNGTTASWQPVVVTDTVQVLGDANVTIGAGTTLARVSTAATTTRTYVMPAASGYTAGKGFTTIFEVTETQTIIFSRAGSDTLNGFNTFTVVKSYRGTRLYFESNGSTSWSVSQTVPDPADGAIDFGPVALVSFDGFSMHWAYPGALWDSANDSVGLVIADSTASFYPAAINVDFVLEGNVTGTGKLIVDASAGAGLQVSSSTSSKLGFYGASPVVRPSGNILTAITNLGLVGSPTILVSSLTETIQTVGNANASLSGTNTIVRLTASLTTSRTYSLPVATSYSSGKGFVFISDVGQGGVDIVFARAGSDTTNGVAGNYVIDTSTVGFSRGDRIVFTSDGTSAWSITYIINDTSKPSQLWDTPGGTASLISGDDELDLLVDEIFLGRTAATVCQVNPFTTGGIVFGDATSRKFGFYGVTPIVQPTGNILTALTNLGLVGSPTLPVASTSVSGAVKVDGTSITISGGVISSTVGGGSGTVTNTGGNLTANSVVLGAGTVDSKVVAGIITDGVSKITLGVAGTSVGGVALFNATSGSITIQPATGALGTVTLILPAATDTLVGKATTDTLINKTLTSPILTTPAIGTPTAGVLTSCTGLPVSTGISGLGTGVATFLATPSSANLASAVTGATGSGALVFGTAPTIAGGTHTAITSFGIRSTGAAFDLTVASSEVLTAGRILSVNVGDAARTLTFSGSPTLSGITTTGTGTLALGTKTLTLSNTITFAGTDSTTMTFPTTSATIARTDAANTFIGHQTIESVTSTGATGTGNLVFSISPTFTTPLLGTPTSGTLTNCTFPTLNQDTTGKSAKTDAINSATTVVNVASATAPATGQVLTATSSTAATWQTPSAGLTLGRTLQLCQNNFLL